MDKKDFNKLVDAFMQGKVPPQALREGKERLISLKAYLSRFYNTIFKAIDDSLKIEGPAEKDEEKDEIDRACGLYVALLMLTWRTRVFVTRQNYEPNHVEGLAKVLIDAQEEYGKKLEQQGVNMAELEDTIQPAMDELDKHIARLDQLLQKAEQRGFAKA